MIDDRLLVFVAVFNEEHDIGTYTIKAVDDPRTLNKILYIKPPKNTLSFNDLISLWEKKIGKSLEKTYIPKEQVLKLIQGMQMKKKPSVSFISVAFFVWVFSHISFLVFMIASESEFPMNILLAINHSIFVNGDLTNFEIEPSFGVEASELYPEVKYTTIDEYLNRFV